MFFCNKTNENCRELYSNQVDLIWRSAIKRPIDSTTGTTSGQTDTTSGQTSTTSEQTSTTSGHPSTTNGKTKGQASTTCRKTSTTSGETSTTSGETSTASSKTDQAKDYEWPDVSGQTWRNSFFSWKRLSENPYLWWLYLLAPSVKVS